MEKPYICFESGTVLLAESGKWTRIYVDCTEASVIRAAEDLCRDIKMVTDADCVLTADAGKAAIEIRMVPDGRWECHSLELADGKLVICGSDPRGTIFGIYELSQAIGVSPWYWWADVPIAHHNQIFVTLDQPLLFGEPSVRFRGIFLNDEESMAKWALYRGDFDYEEVYIHVYELLLRLKANTLWPAMHVCSPHFHKKKENVTTARAYGIIIGSSHCEQMLRNNQLEYQEFETRWVKEHPDKRLYRMDLSDAKQSAYVYVKEDPICKERVYNDELLYDYWKESVEQFGSYDNIYTVGMRGIHDWPWQPVGAETPEEKAKILQEVIALQRRILSQTIDRDVSRIPQLFVPYKEILDIYNAGMDIPDDITLMWTNDNYGYIRQLPTQAEKERSGGIGLYYHLAYCGCPQSYLWMSTTPYALMQEELVKAYENGIDRIWIFNVGDLKGAEVQMEYGLSLAWDIRKEADIRDHIAKRAERDYLVSRELAEQFAKNELEFQRLPFARKPEHFVRDLFGLKEYGDEGARYLERYERVLEYAESFGSNLEETRKNAYFELHLYRIRSCRNTAVQYIMMDEQKQHLQDGYKYAAEEYIYRSDQAFYRIMEDTRYYHEMLGKKWNHMMDSAYGFFTTREHSYPLLACEKQWGPDGIGAAYEELNFSKDTRSRCFVDLFHHYVYYETWTLEFDQPWMIADKYSGNLIGDERIWLEVDWKKAPKGMLNANAFITSGKGQKLTIPIKARNDGLEFPTGMFVEENGAVSIFAIHAEKKLVGNGLCWKRQPYLGREMDSIKVCRCERTIQKEEKTEQGASLEYSIYFNSSGSFLLEIMRIPTLDERGQIRIAVRVDEGEEVILQGNNRYQDFASDQDVWGKGVLQNCEIMTAMLMVKKAGKHRMRVRAIDENVIIEKIVIWTGQKKKSYFGPPETIRNAKE